MYGYSYGVSRDYANGSFASCAEVLGNLRDSLTSGIKGVRVGKKNQ